MNIVWWDIMWDAGTTAPMSDATDWASDWQYATKPNNYTQ